MKENIQKIFKNWNETIIWSCLQGIMGKILTNSSEDAAMAILGDFAFYAGNPSEELVKYKPESCKQDFIIMVPQNAGWAELIEKGLAYACGAKLILECLEEGLYPSWDAQNKWSVALAEKLGYHFSHEYVAYEIMGY